MTEQHSRTTSVTTKIRTTVLLIIIILAVGLMSVMGFFMNSLTDSIMLDTLQPMAKTAAQSIEGNLHTLAERFFMIRDNTVISSPTSTKLEKESALGKSLSGIEFTWIGIYESNGKLLAGSEECPRNISGRKLFASIRATNKLVIEDTSIGFSGPEITMGLPVNAVETGGRDEDKPEYYLVGGYNYEVLSDILQNINVGTNGTAFIINNRGQLIAHRDVDKVFDREDDSENGLGFGQDAESVLVPMKQGLTGSIEIDGIEGKMFVSFSPIRGTLWSLGIQAPRSDFTAAAIQARTIGTLITLASIVTFSIFLTLYIRGILSVPLGVITDSAEKLADGKFENLLPSKVVYRRDEIGRLGATFLAMSNSIQNLIQDIGQLTGDAREGKLGNRADYSAYHGDYSLILSGINATLDVFCSHLDIMPEALMFLDESRRVLYLNRTMNDMLKLHGLDKDAPRLLSALSGAADDDLPAEAASLFTQDGAGNTFKTDVNISDTLGEVRNYDLSLWRVGSDAAPVENWGGSQVCVMLILNDVTQLTRARIDAEVASRTKGDFLSRMSHEMRTPMNAIMGMSSIGLSSDDADRMKYCLTRIGEASQHLLGVINDILDMSKIEADKLELSFTETNFEKMLQRVTNVINFRLEEKNQNLFVSIDKDIPTNIIADEQRLTQVITNLLSNAVKFTPEEGAIIMRAQKTSEKKDTCTILFEVKDTGIGISEEQKNRLFTPFEQADGGIARKFGGTGLGLAISKRIIELMGGSIWVESEIDRGSSFFFAIEVKKGQDSPSVSKLQDGCANLRVLAVDSAPEILEFFTSVLAPYNIHCETAVSEKNALEALDKNMAAPFHIIFAAQRMPADNGIELAKEIAGRGVASAVVLMTNGEYAKVENDARAVGISRFLQKPLFPSTVIACVEEYLGEWQDEALCDTPETEDSIDGIFDGKSILIAEDVDLNREIIEVLIEPTGVGIDFAFDGEEAVAKFKSDPDKYQLILMDLNMPKMDGYEATRQIRASGLPSADTLPIVAMTANVFREDVERCLACGMNGHLGKPVDMKAIINTLSSYLT